MKKEQLDLENRMVWIPDSKTPNGIAEVPLTEIAVEAFRQQLALSGTSPFLFPSDENEDGHQKTFRTVWHATLRRAVRYFRIYDLRSTYATRLSAGGVADEFVTQLLRQGDAKVFKKYSQMKLQMKREALAKLNRQANEGGRSFGTGGQTEKGFGTSTVEAKDGRKRWNAGQPTLLESAGGLVGAGRFERPTPCAQGRCATRLRYAPTSEASLILNHFLIDHPSRNPFSAQKRIKTVSKPRSLHVDRIKTLRLVGLAIDLFEGLPFHLLNSIARSFPINTSKFFRISGPRRESEPRQ